jgi:predicted RNA-binding protein with RPS1 domain
LEDLTSKETTLSQPNGQPIEAAEKPEQPVNAEVVAEPQATEEGTIAEAAPAAEAETPETAKSEEPKSEEPKSEEAKPKEAAPAKPAAPRLADLQPGAVVEGKVTRIERYGAFVDLGLAERRDGLIHISELAPYRVRRVEDVVKVGDEIKARVVSVDLNRSRIALSLNDVEAEHYDVEAKTRSNEPMITAMAAAFERAYGRLREQEAKSGNSTRRNDRGSKAKKAHEMLMEKYRSNKQ